MANTKKNHGKILKIDHQKIMLKFATAEISSLYQKNRSSVVKTEFRRCNFSVFARYSLKFTRSSFLVVKSLISRCKICLSPVADIACCKKSLATHCRRYLFKKIISYLLRNLLITCCKSCSLQIITCYLLPNLLVTRCRSCSLQKITRYML